MVFVDIRRLVGLAKGLDPILADIGALSQPFVRCLYA